MLEVMKAFDTWDGTVKSFCTKKGINYQKFAYWRNKLKAKDTADDAKFIALRQPSIGRANIVVRIKGGIEILLPAHYPVSQLSGLLKALSC